MNQISQLSIEQAQKKTKKELEVLGKSLDNIPEDKLPLLSRCIKGIIYERLGLIREANNILLNIYRHHSQGAALWTLVNEFRVIHGAKLSDARPRILTNIVGGRIGLSLLPHADTISFVPGSHLKRLHASVVNYRLHKDSFMDVISQLPPQWKPDYVLLFLTETHSLPAGLEKSPYPVIGLPGDPWKFYKSFCDVKFFDAVMPAVKCLCPAYALLGNVKTLYSSNSGIQGLIPWQSIKPLPPHHKKEYDVVITGTLCNHFYRKRGQYVWRLLKLAQRYRIFAGRVPSLGDCYEIMKRAKIVIHCPSIQGGVNLRPFEAIACGALLLHEAGDHSIEEFFVPDKEVVLFTEDNFEQIIEYYLNHDRERRQIVKQAVRRNYQYANIVSLMKNVIQEIEQSKVIVTSKPANKLTDDMKFNALGISSFYAKEYDLAILRFSKAIMINENNKTYYNNLAVCLMVQTFLKKQTSPLIEPLLMIANRPGTETVVSVFNLISFYRFVQFNHERFLHLADSLISNISNKTITLPMFSGNELFFYLENSGEQMPESHIFLLELESLLKSFPDQGLRYQNGFTRTILWRILEYKGNYYEKLNNRDNAIRAYLSALEYCPRNEFILEKVSKLYCDDEQWDTAEIYLRRLLQYSPLNENAHLWLSKIELARGEKEKVKERVFPLLHLDSLTFRKEFQFFTEQVSYDEIPFHNYEIHQKHILKR